MHEDLISTPKGAICQPRATWPLIQTLPRLARDPGSRDANMEIHPRLLAEFP